MGLAVLGASAAIALSALVASCSGSGSSTTTAPYVAPAASTSVVERSGVGGALDGAPRSSDAADGALTASGLPAATVTSDDPAPASATGATGRFVVASVALDVPLERQGYSSTLVPPGYTDAYEAEGEGWSGAGQPRLITLHSCSHRTDCPGNALTQGGVSTVGVGDAVEVDGRSYEITSTEIRDKDAISTSPAWSTLTSASLVIVTCSPDGRAHSVGNLLIRAEEVLP